MYIASSGPSIVSHLIWVEPWELPTCIVMNREQKSVQEN
jgi:hypothetical protein